MALLELRPEERGSALDALCAEHPELAATLQRRWEILAHFSCLAEDTDDAETLPFEQVGPYRLIQLIGVGGMGAVYLAHEEGVGRLVALKLMRRELLAERRTRERFQREIVAASRLDHPHICTVYASGLVDDVPYYAMQLVAGSSLAELIRGSKAADGGESALDLPERSGSPSGESNERGPGSGSSSRRLNRVLALIEKAARALHHAHESGFVHRDIKPANIMVTPEGDPVVLDFGLVWADDEELQTLTRSGERIGTPAYMSPEQISGPGRRPDRRSDVYSLGATLFECLTLRCPFEGLTREALYREILEAPLPNPARWNPRIPRDLRVVLETALDRSPDRRYQTCEDLADDLRSVRERRPIAARPLPPHVRAIRWVQRNTLAAAISAALAIGLGTTLWQYRESAGNAAALAQKVEEFELLSLVVEVEEARAAVAKLHPAWPAQIPAMEAWLEGPYRGIMDEIPRLRRVRDGIRERGVPMSDAESAAFEAAIEESTGPLQRELGARRRALEVFRGAPLAPLPDLGEEHQAMSFWELFGFVAARVTGVATGRIWGEELLALACARALQARDEPDVRALAAALLSVAHAQLANGLTDEALGTAAACRAALGPVDARNRAVILAQLDQLEFEIRAFDDAAEERRIAELERQIEVGRLRVDSDGARRFHADTDRFLYEVLTGVLADSVELDGVDAGRVREHLDWAGRVRQLSVLDHATSWAAARDAIATADGVVASSDYATVSLDLRPQIGLVPIGMNPRTGLWEFYHLRSAAPGVAIPGVADFDEHGRLPVEDGTGMVFVLVPGGAVQMGAQKDDPSGPNYDRYATNGEHPYDSGPVQLAPFFLSKYELTAGQWERLSGRPAPNHYAPGQQSFGSRIVTAAHPVERVGQEDCERLLSEFGLQLPTEAQWEYACRAGMRTAWSTGDDPKGLDGYANVFDQFAAKNWPGRDREYAEPFDDGFAMHAPVGRFLPNPWGICDVHGNVGEWCRDQFGAYNLPVEPGDGLRRVSKTSVVLHVSRGGSYYNPAVAARSAWRNVRAAGARDADLGCRPARRILR